MATPPSKPLSGDGTAPNYGADLDPQPGERFHVYTQLPSIQFQSTFTYDQVNEAIRQHELGNFQAAALLCDAMTRDDAVDATLSARVDGLLGLDRIVEPAENGNLRGGKMISRIIGDRFGQFFPLSATAPMKRWQILMGFSVAQVIWRPNEDNSEWMPHIEPWHPAFIYVDISTHTYFALSTEGPVQITPGTGQWILYAPQGHRYAWMTGAIRSIATPWLARQYTWRDWLRANELYSLGIRKAVVPKSASEPAKKAFFQQVASLGSNSTVMLPQGDTVDGPSFDIDVLFPPTGNGATGFDTLMSKAESKIAIRINGQNLTTEAKGGSFAAAKVHENVMEGILDSDSTSLGECLAQQVVVPYIDFHPFPNNTKPPQMSWNTAPPEDMNKTADGFLKIAQALAAFGSAHAPADPRAILIKYDIPVLPEGAPIPGPPAGPAPGVPVVAPDAANVPAPSTDGGASHPAPQPAQTPPGALAIRLDAGDFDTGVSASASAQRDALAELQARHQAALQKALRSSIQSGNTGTIKQSVNDSLARMRVNAAKLGQQHLLQLAGAEGTKLDPFTVSAERNKLMNVAASGLSRDARLAMKAGSKKSALSDVEAQSDRLARTETARSYNEGLHSAAKQLGISLAWSADASACDDCADLDGTTDWDDTPPAHPNCGCVLTPDSD